VELPKWRAATVLTILFAPMLAAQTAANWTQQFPKNSPSARTTAIAYDSGHNQIVLFGGFDTTGRALSDTWLWDGSNWTQQGFVTGPSPRGLHAMAYDSAHGQVVLFGGATQMEML
jgi:Galactose oxidase, central domain